MVKHTTQSPAFRAFHLLFPSPRRCQTSGFRGKKVCFFSISLLCCNVVKAFGGAGVGGVWSGEHIRLHLSGWSQAGATEWPALCLHLSLLHSFPPFIHLVTLLINQGQLLRKIDMIFDFMDIVGAWGRHWLNTDVNAFITKTKMSFPLPECSGRFCT